MKNNNISELSKENTNAIDRPEMLTPTTNLPRKDLLRKFKFFSEVDCNLQFTYILNERDKYKEIISEYGIDSLISGKEDIELMFSLLDWVCMNINHDGQSDMPKERDAVTILEYCKKKI